MYMTYTEDSSVNDLRASAIVLHYAASMFLNAANAVGDQHSMEAGNSILELLTQVMPSANQLPS